MFFYLLTHFCTWLQISHIRHHICRQCDVMVTFVTPGCYSVSFVSRTVIFFIQASLPYAKYKTDSVVTFCENYYSATSFLIN